MESSSQITISDQVNLQKVSTKPFSGQKPGTSGLRKKVNYLFYISFSIFIFVCSLKRRKFKTPLSHSLAYLNIFENLDIFNNSWNFSKYYFFPISPFSN